MGVDSSTVAIVRLTREKSSSRFLFGVGRNHGYCRTIDIDCRVLEGDRGPFLLSCRGRKSQRDEGHGRKTEQLRRDHPEKTQISSVAFERWRILSIWGDDLYEDINALNETI